MMTTFQLLLFLVAGIILYLFFKQLFSGNHPKRGIDFEAKVSDSQIGGINRPDKIFSTPVKQPSRIEQLLQMADSAVEKEDFNEASKALGALLIIDENNLEALGKMGYVSMRQASYEEAKEYYEKLLALDQNDDMAYAQFANVLHKLSDEEGAIKNHKKSIELDPQYAPHYFNYANTLYDLGKLEEALAQYTNAYKLDNTITVAKEMIEKLGTTHE